MSVIIRLQNLPLTAAAPEVRTFFSGLKIPDGAVHIVGGPEGDVFVGFASDEDARQAMRRDRMKIHDAEVRLFLSSKAEMTSVIDQAKSGYFPPAEAEPEPLPVPVVAPPKPTWQLPPQPAPERPANPYAARPGYTASYPPKMNDFSPTFGRNTMQQHEAEQSALRAAAAAAAPEKLYNEPATSFSYDNRAPLKYNQPPQRSSYQQPSPQSTSKPQPAEDNGGPFAGLPPHLRPPYGIPPPQMRQAFNNDSGKPLAMKEMPKRELMDINLSNSAEPPMRQATDSWRGNMPNQQFRNSDETNRRRPLIGNGAPIRPYSNSAPQKPGILPLPNSQNGNHSFYVELTRMPNDLLRPASLEAFIRPSVPLTLSSAKTVFGPGGVHVHTLVRLDSHDDWMAMLKRDGEMGIRIRRSTKREFDDAVEGVPGAPILPPVMNQRHGLDDSRRRNPSPPRRRRSRSPPRRRRSPVAGDENRKRDRSRSRSPRRDRSPDRRRKDRSPPRRRRRSLSRESRVGHTDPTRWCLQVTNVPFRIKEEELLEWFSEKVRPAKLHRTFYSDGNASDRWIAEFSSESLMDRAFAIRKLCTGRTLRLAYIPNDKADEILLIEDVYGNEKKQKNEERRENAEKSNPLSFFSAPPMKVNTSGTNGVGPAIPSPTSLYSSSFPMPARGGIIPRGYPPRGGVGAMMGGGRGASYGANGGYGNYQNQPPNDMYRGGYRGGYRGSRGAPLNHTPVGAFNRNNGSYSPPKKQQQQQQEQQTNEQNGVPDEMLGYINSIGPKGTVLSCNGFPTDVTMEDVMALFNQYDVDASSVRIRRDEDGVITGECMFACGDAEKAQAAVEEVDGHSIRGSKIHLSVANP